ERTRTGWTTPCARTDSASPFCASESNRLRGWRGFGWIESTGSSDSSPAAAPPSRTSRPFPRPLRLGTLDKLHRHLPVRIGATRAAVVRDRGQTVTRRFRETHGARHRGLEHEVAEVAADFVLHLGRETRPPVDHRHE